MDRQPPRRGVQGDDLVALRWPMEPALGPDQHHLAFVVAQYDATADRLAHAVYRLDVRGNLAPVAPPPSGGAPTDTRRGSATPAVTDEHHPVEQRRPRWSSDGTALGWLAGTGSERRVEVATPTGIWRSDLVDPVTVFDLAGDGHHALAAVDRGPVQSRQESVGLASADAAGAAAHDRYELWHVEVGGGVARRCWSGTAPITAVVWAPDARRYAFVVTEPACPDHASTAQLWIAEDPHDDPAIEVAGFGSIMTVAFSPDSRRMAFVGTREAGDPAANRGIWVVDGAIRQVAQRLDRSLGQVVRGDDERGIGPPCLVWTLDGHSLLVPVADRGQSALLRVPVSDDDGPSQMVASCERGSVLEAAMAGDGTVAVTWSDEHHPGDVSLVADGGHLEPLTDLNGPWCESVELVGSTRVQAAVDDHVVDSWLIVPTDVRSDNQQALMPLVVEIHGGPHYPIGERFSFNAQRWAAQGYAVLRVNPRGSQGYGQAFARAVYGDWGGGDLADVIAVLDGAIERAPIDPRRVAIVGESYGGYLAAWALAATERFCAGIAENGLCDLVAASMSHPDPSFWIAELGGPPWETFQHAHERSPLMHAAAIDAPLLLVRATADEVVDAYQVHALWRALRMLGAPVDLLEIPQEGHFVNVTGRPSSRIARGATIDAWLATHLGHDRRDVTEEPSLQRRDGR